MPDLFGISDLALAQAAGVHLDTARRWKRRGRVPAPLAPFIRMKLEGDLAALDRDWCGWKLHAGDLWSPEGYAFAPGDLRALPYLRALHQELLNRSREQRQLELPLLSLEQLAP